MVWSACSLIDFLDWLIDWIGRIDFLNGFDRSRLDWIDWLICWLMDLFAFALFCWLVWFGWFELIGLIDWIDLTDLIDWFDLLTVFMFSLLKLINLLNGFIVVQRLYQIDLSRWFDWLIVCLDWFDGFDWVFWLMYL